MSTKKRAIARFVVSHGSLRVVVRVLPTIRDVDAEYYQGRRRASGKTTHAFFQEMPGSRYVGQIVLPADGRLIELVPHEADHAATHHFTVVHRDDDERHAAAVGKITARILDRCARQGIGRS